MADRKDYGDKLDAVGTVVRALIEELETDIATSDFLDYRLISVTTWLHRAHIDLKHAASTSRWYDTWPGDDR